MLHLRPVVNHLPIEFPVLDRLFRQTSTAKNCRTLRIVIQAIKYREFYWQVIYNWPQVKHGQVVMYLPVSSPQHLCTIYRLRYASRELESGDADAVNIPMATASKHHPTIVIPGPMPMDIEPWIPLLYRLHTWYHPVPEKGWFYSGQTVKDRRFYFDSSNVRSLKRTELKNLAQLYEHVCLALYGEKRAFDLRAPHVAVFYNVLLCLGHVLKVPGLDEYEFIHTAERKPGTASPKSPHFPYLRARVVEQQLIPKVSRQTMESKILAAITEYRIRIAAFNTIF